MLDAQLYNIALADDVRICPCAQTQTDLWRFVICELWTGVAHVCACVTLVCACPPMLRSMATRPPGNDNDDDEMRGKGQSRVSRRHVANVSCV